MILVSIQELIKHLPLRSGEKLYKLFVVPSGFAMVANGRGFGVVTNSVSEQVPRLFKVKTEPLRNMDVEPPVTDFGQPEHEGNRILPIEVAAHRLDADRKWLSCHES